MGISRIRILYPESVFRAQMICRNVAVPEDVWAEGVLATDDNGTFLILDRKAGEGAYGCCEADMTTLGLWSGFSDGDSRDIFEGDIVTAEFFETDEILEPPQFDDEQQIILPERDTYIYAPEFDKIRKTLSGVVFMSNGMFYIQYFDSEMGVLSAMPMFMLYAYDGKPVPGCALRIEGNVYDNDVLYRQVLKIEETAYSV